MTALWALLATVLLAAAAPPGWAAGSGVLVLPGLAAFYVVAVSGRRAAWWCYAIGFAYAAAFSWSLRHVFWAGYVGVAFLAGFYYALVVPWTRVLARWLSPAWAFGLAIAGVHWLRAVMPEIPYPHGQPIHALCGWPAVLGSVAWGGEVLGNVLLGALAAAAVELWRAWRIARPSWSRAVVQLGVVMGVTALVTVVWPPRAVEKQPAPSTDVVAIEPGFEPAFQSERDYWLHYQESLLKPTVAVAGQQAADPPDLVLWPETSYPLPFDARTDPPSLDGRGLPRLAADTLLVLGTTGLFENGRRTPVGVAIDAHDRVVGVHEKLVLAPAGEYLPALWALPRSLREKLLDWLAQTFQAVPDFEPGDLRPPMRTLDGVPFGVMLCYDNAFPAIARQEVAAGARFLVVLSNESWYRRGNELAQLEASTICRALETRTPVVRCTVDGSTMAVDADGDVVERLPYAGGERGPRTMRVRVTAAAGGLPPLSWLQPTATWVVALSGLALVWQAVVGGARLSRVRRRDAPPAQDPATVP